MYFAFVIDVFSRRIVGWRSAGHMRTDLILDVLRMARRRRRRRSQRRRQPVHQQRLPQTLDDAVLASISVGDALDALAESFVDTFKTELIADRVWRSRSQLELTIVEYGSTSMSARKRPARSTNPFR